MDICYHHITILKGGVEINETAIEEAKKRMEIKFIHHLKICQIIFFDTIISNHALEHCDNPFIELKELHRALRKMEKYVL